MANKPKKATPLTVSGERRKNMENKTQTAVNEMTAQQTIVNETTEEQTTVNETTEQSTVIETVETQQSAVINLNIADMETKDTEYEFSLSTVQSNNTTVDIYSLKLKNGTYHNFKSIEAAELAHKFIGLELADSQVQRLKARTLYKMSKLAVTEGFQDIGEMAQRLFGFSASTARNYCRIGQWFVDDNGGMVSDFGNALLSMGQLNTLLSSLKKADFELQEGEENTESLANVIRLFTPSTPDNDDTLLSPGMKRDEMARRIKEFRNKERSLHGKPLLSDEMKKKKAAASKTATNDTKSTTNGGSATGTEQNEKLPFDNETFPKIRNIVALHMDLVEALKNPLDDEEYYNALEEINRNSLVKKLEDLVEIVRTTNALVAEIKAIIG